MAAALAVFSSASGATSKKDAAILGSGAVAQPDPALWPGVVLTPGDEPGGPVRRHYMWSNERRHDIFFDDIQGLSGGYLGVGGDQNYTLAAAAASQVIWLVDIDREVVKLHKLYAALLQAAQDPQGFVALFEKSKTAQIEAALGSVQPTLRKQLLVLYTQYRQDLLSHLRDELSQPHTWLGDGKKFAYLRDMAQKQLIVPRLGDLNGPRTMQQIAQAAQNARLPIRLIYLSNAESWFGYGAGFRKNMAALPLDDRSCVLRTVKSDLLPYVRGDVWHYTAQKGQHFVTKLAERFYGSIDYVMLDAVQTEKKGLSHVGFAPLPDPPTDPKAAARFGQAEKVRRQKLLSEGLVTRPAGNRENAAEFEEDRKQKAAQELQALEKRLGR